MRIILGSESLRRLENMRTIVPDVEQMAADINEDEVREWYAGKGIRVITSAIALQKSHALRKQIRSDAIILSADTMMDYKGDVRGKPRDADQARQYLRTSRKGLTDVVTALVGYNTRNNRDVALVDSATISFTGLTDEAIERIIADGIALKACGAIVSEHPLFRAYIGISGDPETVQGLPTRLVRPMLAALQEV